MPLSYYLGVKWLSNFAYHIDIDPLKFLLASILILVLALVTISFQYLQASFYIFAILKQIFVQLNTLQKVLVLYLANYPVNIDILVQSILQPY